VLNGASEKELALSQETFDELLAWLHPDRDEAGKKYVDIRGRLIKIFIYRGSVVAEDLADETINRVARKVREIKSHYAGDPFLYFHGVARYVYLEYSKKKQPAPLPFILTSTPDEDDPAEMEHFCLERCMERLTPQNRKLILEYFQDDKRAKIDRRQELTRQLGISLNALRIRMHRVCATLKECMHECLKATQV
jgi:DNA-directed RNA polymerase specialized sigma24 family protein